MAVTPEQRRRVLELHGQGLGRNAIAREANVAAGTVTAIVHAAGLDFDRTPGVIAGTKARKVDLADRRSALELAYLVDAERLRALVWQPHTYYELGRFSEPDGDRSRSWSEFVEHEQDTPTPSDQLKLVQASRAAWLSSKEIAEASSGADVAGAKSMLQGLQDALGGAWRAMLAAEAEEAGE